MKGRDANRYALRMVIWRGWGIIVFGYIALAMILFMGLGSQFLPESALPYSGAIGLAIAAVATWFTGQAMNVTRPQKKIDAWYQAREQQLAQLVSSGQFSLGPGQAPPTSAAEAQSQSEVLLQQELRQARRSRNAHTMFFIPMQYWAFIIGAAAIVLLVLGILGIGS